MRQPHQTSRRDVIKTLGAGAALVALGTMRAQTPAPSAKAPAVEAKAPPPQPFVLPPLPYGFDALEPAVDTRTMELHHDKHHQAYIDAANRALVEHPEWRKKTAEELLAQIMSAPEALRPAIRNYVGGHVNHCHFWKILTPKGHKKPGKELGSAIDKAFGSFDSLKVRFVDVGMKRFGSGWVWIGLSPNAKLEVFSTANQDSPLMHQYTPIVGIDVWEHAYYLNYQNRRLEYLEAVWALVNWTEADALFASAAAVHPE